jgi:hypothetical protein
MTNRRSASGLVIIATVAVLLPLATGCGKSGPPQLGLVKGTVTLGGAPLSDALVLFTPEGPGRTSQGRTDASGVYRAEYLRDIPGANVGRHTVRITTARKASASKERLPSKYHAKTILTATVLPGENVIDFALDPK